MIRYIPPIYSRDKEEEIVCFNKGNKGLITGSSLWSYINYAQIFSHNGAALNILVRIKAAVP